MLPGCEVLTKKGLQRTALASFHTLSIQRYYIYALGSVGTARKMSSSHCGKRREFLKCRGKNKMQIRCVSISHVEENKLSFHTDFQELISIWQVVITFFCRIVQVIFQAFIFKMEIKECTLHTVGHRVQLHRSIILGRDNM